MKNLQTIFMALYDANSEEEVDQVLEQYSSLFNNNENWLPYGGNKGNYGTFENQQNNPIPALIEKITNSIDATLIKDCRIHGIDPKSAEAPRTMQDAITRFYNIPDGDVGKLPTAERREIAENIQVMAVGDRQLPSIVIYDNGEGQNPDNFTNSFLSLHNNNKTNIHFVQGKYNMGSTGAVVFCGEKKYQLIASKRNPMLDDADNKFGFTLVRRHQLSPSEEKEYGKATWYEYFSPKGEIASFKVNDIDLGLYGRDFVSGSIVKLYSYQLPTGSRSNITLDLWRDLNQFMYHLPLPISLYEKRDYTTKNPTKIVLGNKTRITIDSRDSVAHIITYNLYKEEIGNVPIEVIVFKNDTEHNEFIKNKSIIFTQNGQVHGFEGQSYISQVLGFSLLKKNTLIHVNCSEIKTSFRQDLFMANRTNLKHGHKTEELKYEITKLLKKSEALRELNNLAKNALLHDSDTDKSLVETMMSKLPADRDVIELLDRNGSLDFLKTAGEKAADTEIEVEHPELNRFPSIFNLNLDINENIGKAYKTIPVNSKGIVKIGTDVENDYFFRPEDAGKLELQVLRTARIDDEDLPIEDPDTPSNANPMRINDILTINREGPVNGVIKLIIEPTEHAQIGDEVEIRAVLSDDTGNRYECVFDVKVDPEISKPKKRTKPSAQTFPNLPTPKKAYENPSSDDQVSWKELNWDADDIVKIITSTDEKSNMMVAGIIVNMDSNVIKNFFSKNKIESENEIRFMKDKYFLSVYLHSLFQFSIVQKSRKKNDKLMALEVDEFIADMMKAYANFLMYENYHVTKMAFSE